MRLLGGPSAYLSAFWAGLEVFFGLCYTEFVGGAFDADLAVEGKPEEVKGDIGVFLDMLAFFA